MNTPPSNRFEGKVWQRRPTPSERKTIFINGINQFTNRGVEALAVSTIEQISARCPDCHTVLLSKSSTYNARRNPGLSVDFVEDAYRRFIPKVFRKLRMLDSLWPSLLSPRFARLRKLTCQSCDLLIASGGDNFGRDYGGFQNFLTQLSDAQRAGVPTVLLGQSIGPFRTSEEQDRFQEVARRAELITCRESGSYSFVRNELGLMGDHVQLTADVAFLLAHSGLDRGKTLLAEAGVSTSRPRLVLSISGGISRFSGLSKDEHRLRWVEIIQRLHSELDVEIVLLPHVWSNRRNGHNNDFAECMAILDKSGSLSKVHLLKADLTAKEYKAVIAATDFVIAERMHAAIAGLSQCIPTVPISYSVKAEGIINDLYRDWPSDEKPLLSIADLMHRSDTTDRILSFFAKRQILRSELIKRMPQMKASAAKNFELLVPLLV